MRIPTAAEAAPLTAEEVTAVVALAAEFGATFLRQERLYGDRSGSQCLVCPPEAPGGDFSLVEAGGASLPRSAAAIARTARLGGWMSRLCVVEPSDVLVKLYRPPFALVLTFSDGKFATGWLIVNRSLPVVIGYRQALNLVKG